MNSNTLIAVSALLLAAAGAPCPGQEPARAATTQPATRPATQSAPTSRPAALGEFAWLEGRWTGQMPAGRIEEVFTAPDGGSIIGMFRLISPEQKTLVLEMTALEQAGESVMLRFRHFTPALEPWEPPKQTPAFYLVDKAAGRFVFQNADPDMLLPTKPHRITWERQGDDVMRFQVDALRDGELRKLMEGEIRRQRP